MASSQYDLDEIMELVRAADDKRCRAVEAARTDSELAVYSDLAAIECAELLHEHWDVLKDVPRNYPDSDLLVVMKHAAAIQTRVQAERWATARSIANSIDSVVTTTRGYPVHRLFDEGLTS